MRFALAEFTDTNGNGRFYWNWRIMEGESPDDPKAVEVTSHARCVGFLRSNLVTDTHYVGPDEIIRDHSRSRFISAGCSSVMSFPDWGDRLVKGLPLLFAGLKPENVKVTPAS